MPKEQIRKRGKRKPKTEQEAPADAPSAGFEAPAVADVPAAEPEAIGGIHPSRLAILKRTGGATQQAVTTQTEEQTAELDERPEGDAEDGPANWTRQYDPEFPFGILDPDVKAYFRNLEDQIKDWEGAGAAGEEREDRQMFLSSVLQELRGHELQVATDPEVGVVLERLLPSLNDWGRRVIGDSFGEKWETLLTHRFGSHIVQTWLTLAASTLDRETRGVYPPQQKKQEKNPEEGVLPTMAELITSFTTTLIPSYPSLLTNTHASPPLRLLLLVLTPNRALPSLDASEGDGGLVRSKRSGKFRKNQSVQGKSILGDEEQKAPTDRQVPESVAALRKRVRKEVMEKVSGVEWHGMGVNKVGSAAVQLFLEAEAEDGESEQAGSLLDIITEGLASNPKDREQKPYLYSLLVSPTGTRLFEAVLAVAPKRVYKAVWKTYFRKKLGKLAAHPYANFVVSKGVARLSAEGLGEAIAEVQAAGGGKVLIKMARTSALVAFAERATALGACGDEVMGLVESAVELPAGSDALVPALMALKTVPVYDALRNGEEVPDDEAAPVEKDEDAEATFEAAQRRSAWENRRSAKPRGALEPNMQGCLLLQALVDMPGSGRVLASLLAQPVDTLLAYAASPIASRLLDRVLLSPAVPKKDKRKLPLAFVGHYLQLCCDRLGSRVAETVWASADGFMREKIARSLIPQATQLAADPFGRFLSRKLELHLLQRRPDEWREKQLGLKHHFAHQKSAQEQQPQPEVEEAEEEPKQEKKKRKGDEIDEVFGKLEKKRKNK